MPSSTYWPIHCRFGLYEVKWAFIHTCTWSASTWLFDSWPTPNLMAVATGVEPNPKWFQILIVPVIILRRYILVASWKAFCKDCLRRHEPDCTENRTADYERQLLGDTRKIAWSNKVCPKCGRRWVISTDKVTGVSRERCSNIYCMCHWKTILTSLRIIQELVFVFKRPVF